MKYYPFVFLFVALLLGACAKSPLTSYPAQWAKNWPSEAKPAQYDSLSKVYYGVHRDETNLYLQVSTQEPASQAKIMRYGLKIWLEPSGQKKTVTGFNFPLPAPDSLAGAGMGQWGGQRGGVGGRGESREGNMPDSLRRREGAREDGQMPSPEQMQQRMLQRIYKRFNEQPKEMVLIGYEGKKKSLILGKDPSDIQVDLEIEEDNFLHYFAVIPLKKIFGEGKAIGDMVAIGIVSGYMEVEPEVLMMMQQSGAGADPTQNPRRAFFAQMLAQMTTPVEIWFSADLRTKKP